MNTTNLAEPATPATRKRRHHHNPHKRFINSGAHKSPPRKLTQRESDRHPRGDVLVGHGQLAGVAVLVLERPHRERIPLGHLFDVVLARFVRFGDVVDHTAGGGARLLDHVPHAEELCGVRNEEKG